MALYTGCILNTDHDFPENIILVSVMNRHTLNDGITPDPRIGSDKYDLHFQILSPSPILLGDHYKRNLPWQNFEWRYLQEIRRDIEKVFLISFIAQFAETFNIALLCIEINPLNCHRRLLAMECKIRRPSLNVIIR